MEYELNIRKRSTLKFIIFFILSGGYYFYIWFWKLVKDVNSISEDKLNFWAIAFLPIILNIVDIYFVINNILYSTDISHWNKICINISTILYILISFILVKYLQKFSVKKYNLKPKYNFLGLIFFMLVYVNYFINTFEKRVAKKSNPYTDNIIV